MTSKKSAQFRATQAEARTSRARTTTRPKAARARLGASTVAEYLAKAPPAAQPMLEQLRGIIQAAAPRASEAISYQIPTFMLNGPLVAYAAFTGHCGFYLLSPPLLQAHAAAIGDYGRGKVSLRFELGEPIPVALVKKLVKARIAEKAARFNRADR